MLLIPQDVYAISNRVGALDARFRDKQFHKPDGYRVSVRELRKRRCKVSHGVFVFRFHFRKRAS